MTTVTVMSVPRKPNAKEVAAFWWIRALQGAAVQRHALRMPARP